MSSEKIEQNWDVTVVNDNPIFPFVVIDNWYTPNEEKAVWKELDFFSVTPKDQIERAEKGVVARFKDGTSKSKAYRFYINQFYEKPEISPILNCMYKQKTPEFHKIIEDNCMPHARSFTSSNSDSSLLSYYEENDYYKPHHDVYSWTCLIWMVREPRLFDGGNFKINEPDVEVKLKNNRMVMFPCYYLHSVSPVKFHTQPKEIGYGRYTMTHFYFSQPQNA
jgi:Rps23 Pro-64 3,4-dihydroxylase Tpa1-like proline 4-hydroxylase|tara:strand:+ start:45 stop:707 length:663 start_codon:yes stop_codon:yes gene_type:complete